MNEYENALNLIESVLCLKCNGKCKGGEDCHFYASLVKLRVLCLRQTDVSQIVVDNSFGNNICLDIICPTCKSIILKVFSFRDVPRLYSYCPVCGQKLVNKQEPEELVYAPYR